MAAETDKAEEIVKDPRKMILNGRVIRFIKRQTGFKWKDFVRVAQEHRNEKGGFVRCSVSGIQSYLAETAKIKTIYAQITEQLVGKEQYQTLLEVAYRDRPEWFSEPSAKQR